MNNTNQKQSCLQTVPFGLQWLWKLAFTHGFWGGFFTVAAMTPALMILISAVWTQNIPSWSEQFKSFIIGDPLLAVIAGLLAILATTKLGAKTYEIHSLFWAKWLGVGALGSALFIGNDILKARLTFEQLFQPHLLYHHIFLFVVLIAMLGGMAFIQYKRFPRSRIWIAIGLLLLAYILLVTYDTIYPPLGIG